jgi:hypothetical protein
MSTNFYHGYQGSVRFSATGTGAAEVTAVTAWSIAVSKETLSTTRVGDTYEKRAGGLISASGSIDLLYTGENNSLIEAVNTSGDTGIALFELYLSSSDSKKISFTGLITSANYGASRDDVQTISCEFVSSGSITLDL